jgi:hypothetical protein
MVSCRRGTSGFSAAPDSSFAWAAVVALPSRSPWRSSPLATVAGSGDAAEAERLGIAPASEGREDGARLCSDTASDGTADVPRLRVLSQAAAGVSLFLVVAIPASSMDAVPASSFAVLSIVRAPCLGDNSASVSVSPRSAL